MGLLGGSSNADLLLRIRADANQAIGEMRQVGQETTRMSGITKAALLAMGAAALAAGRELYQIGVESEAAGARYRAVFGDNTAALDEWVAANRTAFGQATDDMQGMVARVANMLTPLGLSTEAAGENATKILELAAAWSSYSGGAISAERAAEALTKGVLGQTRGLIELGMNAKIVQEIEADMGPDTDNLAGAMGRLQAITEQSGAAMAVHEELMGGALGAQREMETAVNELKDALGGLVIKLAPAVSLLADMVGGVAAVVGSLSGPGAAADEMGDRVYAAFTGSAEAMDQLKAAADAMQGSPVFGDLGDQAAWAAENMEPLRDAVDTVNDAVADLARDMFPEWVAAAEELAEQTDDTAAGQDDLTGAFEDQAAALRDTITQEERLAALRRAAIDPLFAVVDATGRLRQAELDLAAAMATDDVEAAADATERLYGAQLDLNSAASELNTDTAVAQLGNVLEQAGLTAAEIERIIGDILRYNETPFYDKNVTIHYQATGLAPNSPEWDNFVLPGMASGGRLRQGMGIAGEAGPELLIVGPDGVTVIPLGQVPKLQAGGKVEWDGGGKVETGGISNWPYGPGVNLPLGKVEAGGSGAAASGITAMQSAVFERMGWALPQIVGKMEALDLGALLANTPKMEAPIIVNVYVNGYVATEMDLVDTIRRELLRVRKSNTTTGVG